MRIEQDRFSIFKTLGRKLEIGQVYLVLSKMLRTLLLHITLDERLTLTLAHSLSRRNQIVSVLTENEKVCDANVDLDL